MLKTKILAAMHCLDEDIETDLKSSTVNQFTIDGVVNPTPMLLGSEECKHMKKNQNMLIIEPIFIEKFDIMDLRFIVEGITGVAFYKIKMNGNRKKILTVSLIH